jgi:hypothetical protein
MSNDAVDAANRTILSAFDALAGYEELTDLAPGH